MPVWPEYTPSKWFTKACVGIFQVFSFNFNLIATHEGKDSNALNKTCSPSLPWSPREVTFEENYIKKLHALKNPAGSGNNIDRVTILCT
ncbi:hypothetical protein VZT92_019560 [Zoarces viviparus]|uniref:Uncharacterized protein n=1 Tax=Zoarces viviparus TaxID=48416 RepID=A0AAW1EKY4_ZOAVI